MVVSRDFIVPKNISVKCIGQAIGMGEGKFHHKWCVLFWYIWQLRYVNKTLIQVSFGPEIIHPSLRLSYYFPDFFFPLHSHLCYKFLDTIIYWLWTSQHFIYNNGYCLVSNVGLDDHSNRAVVREWRCKPGGCGFEQIWFYLCLWDIYS